MTPDPETTAAYQVSVVAPCLNEEDNLPELVARLQAVFAAAGLVGEIVLVDDGSQDATGAVIDRLAVEHPNVTGRHHDRNRGMEAGWNTGAQAARGSHVCFIDADMQYRPEDVPRLWQALRDSGADIAQGARTTEVKFSDARAVLSRGLNAVLNLAFGMHLRDNKSGFVLGRRETILHVLDHRRSYRYFQALLLVSAHAKGYRIVEVDTPFLPRRHGQSFMAAIPTRVIIGCLLDVATGLREFRGPQPPPRG